MSLPIRGLRPASLLAGLLAAALLLAACGDDDESSEDTVAGPDDDVALDAEVFAELNRATEQAIGLLFTGGGSVEGEGGGRIVVQGNIFTFEDYSPDGVFFLDGDLTMDLLAAPITVQGELRFRNAEGEGDIVVDMTIDAATDPPAYGGTITVDGEVIDVAAIEAGE